MCLDNAIVEDFVYIGVIFSGTGTFKKGEIICINNTKSHV